MLTLALPKGRLAEESIDLMISKGWLSSKPDPNSKELIYNDPKGKFEFYLYVLKMLLLMWNNVQRMQELADGMF